MSTFTGLPGSPSDSFTVTFRSASSGWVIARLNVRNRADLFPGTDATRVSSHNPWISLYWMVTGKSVGGTQLASQENRLSREDALRIAHAWVDDLVAGGFRALAINPR